MTEDELARPLYVTRPRPVAEFGLRAKRKQKGQVRRKRDTWQLEKLALDNFNEAVTVGYRRLADNSEFLTELEQRGCERALIYKTLLLTGLRRAELASLTVGQLELDGDMPYAILNAADEKNREVNAVPLRADLVVDLRIWLSDLLSYAQERARAAGEPVPVSLARGTRLFKVPTGLLRIMNRDMEAAGTPKRDERGRTLDVHALRTTFGTLLSKAGVPLRTAQVALRHSDPSLTANVYTDPKLLDVSGALAALPEFPLHNDSDRDRGRATGTTDTSGFAPGFAPTTDILVQTLAQTDKTGVYQQAGTRNADATISSRPDGGKQSLTSEESNGRYWTRTPPLKPEKNRMFRHKAQQKAQ